MMRLHHADDLEPLLDALAAVVGVPAGDPFVPELVVVPSLGMRDAVVAGLASRLGVSSPDAGDGVIANVHFEFPGRFIGRALGDTSRPGQLSDDPWQIERLTWAVLDVMLSPGISLPRPPDHAELWSFARGIADLFDRYGTQRPRMMQQWSGADGGTDTDGTYHARPGDGSLVPLPAAQAWQPALWRAVRQRLGVSSPAELMPSMLAHLRAGELVAALPPRVSLFGFGSLSTGVLEVARAVAARHEVHAFVRHPSAAAWTGSPHRLAGGLQARAAVDVTAYVSNPLLASWGRSSLEAVALLNGIADIEQVAVAERAPSHPSTVLGALQHGIRLDRTPALVDGVSAADGSVQVHACHGNVRQLEALRDALGHAFVADPTLAAHEVMVVSPRLDEFEPLIESVFSRGSLPVPVRIGDRSLTSADPLGDALVSLLDVLSGRATLSEVVGLLRHDAICDTFGWDTAEVEQVSSWATELGARWGLDAQHRMAWDLPAEIDTGTWRSVVDRLLLGVAMPAASPRIGFAGLSPHDDIGTSEALVAGSLADLISRLLWAHERLAGARPIADWVDALHEITDLFLVERSDEPWGRRALHRTLDSLTEASTIDGTPCAVTLALDDVIRMARRSIAERPGRLRLRTGAVTVTSMQAVQGIPARVVCILGLDDGALRTGTFDGDDVLGLNQCLGERHPRHETRQMLLDAVLAARDRLIITCNGADLTTNKPVPFVVPLVELLDVVDVITGERGGVVVRHPRHGFSERALVPGALVPASTQPFTFDAAMLAAALARQAGTLSPPADADRWALSPAGRDAVDVDLLVDAVTRPARVYLQQRLELRLPPEPSGDEDGLSIGVDPLGHSGLGRGLLAVLRRGGSVDDWSAAAAQDGTLPPASLGRHAIERVRDEILDLAQLAADAGVPLAGADEVQVELSHPSPFAHGGTTGDAQHVLVAGVVDSIHLDGLSATVVDIDYRRPRSSQRLSLAVRLALAELAAPDRDWRGLLVTRAKSGPRAQSTTLRIAGSDAERQQHARSLVDLALQLAEWSMRDAVPLFDTVSEHLSAGRYANAAGSLDESHPDAYQSMLWPGLSLTTLLAEPVRSTDPEPVRALAAAHGLCRAESTAWWVWGTIRAAVVEQSGGASSADGEHEGDD